MAKKPKTLEQLDQEFGNFLTGDWQALLERIEHLETQLSQVAAFTESPVFKLALAQGKGTPQLTLADASSGGPSIDFGAAVMAIHDYMDVTGQFHKWFTAYEVAAMAGKASLARNIGHFMNRMFEESQEIYDAAHRKHVFPFEPVGKYGATRAWGIKGNQFSTPLSKADKLSLGILQRVTGKSEDPT